MTATKHYLLIFFMLSALFLSGCREEEQGRPLSYDKGVYGGQADNSLSAETVYGFRNRAKGQSWY